jgi:hypothetical protein
MRHKPWVERFAADQGLLDETNGYCELKKDLPPSAQNTEIGGDLASLSVRGGILIVGIEDQGGGKGGKVLGVSAPDGCRQRLIGIAGAIVRPALTCDVSIIATPLSATPTPYDGAASTRPPRSRSNATSGCDGFQCTCGQAKFPPTRVKTSRPTQDTLGGL